MFTEKSILLLDDSPIVCKLIKALLNESGYSHVETVSEIGAAKTVLETMRPELVLLDYNIEGGNSEEFLDYVKTKFPDTIIIMLSGQKEKEVVVKLMRKVSDYIIKEDVSKMKDELLHSIDHAFEISELKKQNTRLVREINQRNEILSKQLETAHFLLKEIFSDKIDQSPIFNICVRNWPWEVIGGDFYHIDRLDDGKIGIFIADICGHGIKSALLLFTLSNSYREVIAEKLPARKTMRKLNSLLLKQLPESVFVTCCFLVLDEVNECVYFSSAFETPVLFLRENGEIAELQNGELRSLGIFDTDSGLFGNKEFFTETEIKLKPGEKIFLLTDGALEVWDSSGDQFGIEGIKNAIVELKDKSLPEILDSIHDRISRFSENNIKDDITIMGIEKI